jgi:hypothetical protein
MLFYYDLYNQEETYVAFYPQIHLKFSPTLTIKIGIGLFCGKSKIVPQFAHKINISNSKDPNIEHLFNRDKTIAVEAP